MRRGRIFAALACMAWLATAAAQDVIDETGLHETVESSTLWKREHVLEDAGRFRSAIAVCVEIGRKYPRQNALALSTIAGLNGRQGRYHDEIEWARRALAADPKLFQAEINVGTAQAQLGHPELAQAAYERAQALAPASPLPVYSLGALAEARHDVAAATGFYERSVALDPKFASGWFNLAAMQARAGRLDDALASLDKVLALDPKAEDAKAMRRHVEADRAAGKR